MVTNFTSINGIKFRFWDIPAIVGTSSVNTTFSQLCDVFTPSTLAYINKSVNCDAGDICPSHFEGISCLFERQSAQVDAINFSGKNIFGFLPSTINEIDSLTSLDLSHNKFIGTIPTSFGLLSNLVSLKLDGNKLTGPVPSSLCQLNTLSVLRLSNNAFTCLDPCMFQLVDHLVQFDFNDSIPMCSFYLPAQSITPATTAAWAQCSYPENPQPVANWQPLDYCTFYDLNKCSNSSKLGFSSPGCPPSCLALSPLDYCLSYSLLQLSCSADGFGSYGGALQTAADCLKSFEEKSPTLSVLKIEFYFNLTNVNTAAIQVNADDGISFDTFFSSVTQSLALALAVLPSDIELSAEADFFSVIGGFFFNVRSVTLHITVSRSLESIGSNSISLQSRILSGLTAAHNQTDSLFIVYLKDYFSGNGRRRLQSLGSFITPTTGNTPPVIVSETVNYTRTIAPTPSPMSSVSKLPMGSTTKPPSYLPMPLATTFSPTSAPSSSLGRTCIRLELLDQFGDGWDTASLLIVPSHGEQQSYAPSCRENPLVRKYCFDEGLNNDGSYAVIRAAGLSPAKPWEVLWRITNGYNGRVYYGDYSTVMVFVYRQERVAAKYETPVPTVQQFDSWVELYHAINIEKISDELCDTCVNSRATSSFSSNPAVALSASNEVVLEYNSSMVEVGVFGHPQFYLSSDNQGLVTSGTICSTGSLDCGLRIPNGKYQLRVSGSYGAKASKSLTWEYCGVEGRQGYELTFSIADGSCVPQQLLSVIGVCNNESAHYDDQLLYEVTNVRGLIRMEGVSDVVFATAEVGIIEQALAREFTDAGLTVDSKPIIDLSLVSLDTVPGGRSRRLSSQAVHASFEARLISGRLDINDLKTYLDVSMSTGIFLTRMRSLSNLKKGVAFTGIKKVSLLDLQVIHETTERPLLSIGSTTIVVVGALVGLVFSGLFITTRGWTGIGRKKSYAALETTEHGRGA